jgi:hypothetical protein
LLLFEPIRFSAYLIRRRMFWRSIATIYPFAVGNRKVMGWRRWLFAHRYLLTPWKREYLQWRMLTVFKTPEKLDAGTFWKAMNDNRDQFCEWVIWQGNMLRMRNTTHELVPQDQNRRELHGPD